MHNIEKRDINKSDGNLSAILVGGGSDGTIQKVTMDRNIDNNQCNSSSNVFVGGGIAAASTRSTVNRKSHDSTNLDVDVNSKIEAKDSPSNPFA